MNMCQCLLRPAHPAEEIHSVDVCEKATIGDMLTMLEKTTTYTKQRVMAVKAGRIQPSYMKVTSGLSVAFLLFGHRLNATDVCSMGIESEVSWAVKSTSPSPTLTPRGVARTARNLQQPRSAMLVWAEDRIAREVQGLNMLTVRMLLRAEQRAATAVWHARGPAQTREVLVAAYCRAGLSIEQGPREVQCGESGVLGLDGIRDAMLTQTTITSQIA